MKNQTDILIVGSGAAGLFCALSLPTDKDITIITKDKADQSDSFLAQGGICVLKSEQDYDSYYEDTMRAGHYENRAASVEQMIHSSPDIIHDLEQYGVEFEKENGEFLYTKEGGHSDSRILFHKDITGKEITSKLLMRSQERANITIYENTTMLDIIKEQSRCVGIVAKKSDHTIDTIYADTTIFACGGVGGLYHHSTNYRHITGDAIAIALKHGIQLEHISYVQIHPTTLYSKTPGRRFLISESVRGEGAILLDKEGKRFVDELLPRDRLTKAVREQMKKDHTEFVWLSMAPIPEEAIRSHFPNIYKRCLEEGYDCTKEPIPVVPAQHYFMGGIWVDQNSHSSLDGLYAIGETSCNGVHGRNRLASNSLLESLVFAKQAARHIVDQNTDTFPTKHSQVDLSQYRDIEKLTENYHKLVREKIESGD